MKIKKETKMDKLTINRWLKALEIAKCLFEDEGYHTLFLEEIERHINQIKSDLPTQTTRKERRENGKANQIQVHPSLARP